MPLLAYILVYSYILGNIYMYVYIYIYIWVVHHEFNHMMHAQCRIQVPLLGGGVGADAFFSDLGTLTENTLTKSKKNDRAVGGAGPDFF